MFIGANYKLNAWGLKQTGGYGWEYAKVIDIRANGYHIDAPYQPVITKRINRDFVVYFYDLVDKPNSVRRDIMEISESDFNDAFKMEYSLTSIDGIEEQGSTIIPPLVLQYPSLDRLKPKGAE